MGSLKKSTFPFDVLFYFAHLVAKAFLIAVICFMGIITGVLVVYLGDSVISSGKPPIFSAYVIVSSSMVPTIDVNDAIVIKRVDNDQYKIGDIITFRSTDARYNGLAVTHRIIQKETIQTGKSLYTTKGDHNMLVDPTSVDTASIYGKVLFKIPKIGYLQEYFSKPFHLFIGLLIPFSVFLFYGIVGIKKQKRIIKKI